VTIYTVTSGRLVGQASCMSWSYSIRGGTGDCGWSGDGDTLEISLLPDNSGGGQKVLGVGLDVTITGNFEAHEFISVLAELTDLLRYAIGPPWEVYRDRSAGLQK
jgi:hypothetical protein